MYVSISIVSVVYRVILSFSLLTVRGCGPGAASQCSAEKRRLNCRSLATGWVQRSVNCVRVQIYDVYSLTRARDRFNVITSFGHVRVNGNRLQTKCCFLLHITICTC